MENKKLEYTYDNGNKELFHYTITKKIQGNVEIYFYNFDEINLFWHSIREKETEETIYDKVRSTVEWNNKNK